MLNKRENLLAAERFSPVFVAAATLSPVLCISAMHRPALAAASALKSVLVAATLGSVLAASATLRLMLAAAAPFGPVLAASAILRLTLAAGATPGLFLAIAATLTLTLAAPPADAQMISCEQICDKTEKNSYALVLGRVDIGLARNKIREARNAYYPTLVAGANTQMVEGFDKSNNPQNLTPAVIGQTILPPASKRLRIYLEA